MRDGSVWGLGDSGLWPLPDDPETPVSVALPRAAAARLVAGAGDAFVLGPDGVLPLRGGTAGAPPELGEPGGPGGGESFAIVADGT